MEKYCPKCFKKFPPSVERCPHDGSYLVSPMDRDLTGEVLDERYTVLERIGRGGMGVVYKAEQHLIRRIVALKVLRREIVQDETAVKRFLNEARAIASLDSRHTVTLHDFGVTRDGLIYYTMELLKGRPLSRVIRDEAPIHHARAAGLIIQACRSLEEAHKTGILHRDVKPDNLFVTEKEGKEHIKVVDFGIAKLVGDASMDTVTRTGMIVGTPQYLSPEQALGNPVVPASDLYSLGIVLYEMLAGVPPFQDETPMKTMWAQIRDPVPPLRKKNPSVEVPRSIEAFLARALEKDPGSRFQTATAFSDALRTAVEDHATSPQTVSLPGLSTTDEGLRLKTQAWEAAREKARHSQDDSGGSAGLPRRARETAPAKPDPGRSVVSTDEAPRDIEEPRSTTMQRILAGRRPLYWGLGGGALALAAVLAVWSPWQGSSSAIPDAASEQKPRPEVTGAGNPGLPPPSVTVPGDGAEEADPVAAEALAVESTGGGLGAQSPAEQKREAGENAAREAREEAAKKAEEEAAKKAAEEQEKKRVEEEAAAQRAAELEAAKKKVEEDAARKAAEEDAAKRAAEEARKAEEEAVARARAEDDARQKAEAASKKKAEMESRRKEEAEARRREEAEAQRQAEVEEERRRNEAEARAAKLRELIGGARTEMGKGRFEQALDRLNEAASAGGETSEIKQLRADCYAGIKKRELQKLLAKAKAAAARKDFGSCIESAQQAGKLEPGNVTAEGLLRECKEKKDLEGMKF